MTETPRARAKAYTPSDLGLAQVPDRPPTK